MGDFKILIIKCGASGDVLRSTAILPGLKEKYPNSKIWWVTSSFNYELIKYNKLIDRKVPFNDILKHTSTNVFDLVISLDDEREQCRLATEVEKKKLIGAYLDENHHRVYTKDAEQWFGMGLLRPEERGGKKKADQLKRENTKTHQQHLAEIIGIKSGEMTLNYSEKECNFADNFCRENNINKSDIVISLNTGAGKRWKYKKISEEKTAELAERLIKELGCKILLLGGPEESARNQKIMELTNNQLIDAGCNNKVLEFAALIDKCHTLITSDSMALHIGVALKKKVISFFGPTPAAEIELYGRGKKIVGKVPCIVCYLPDCDVRPTCMDTISVDEFVEAVKEYHPTKNNKN